MAGFAHSRLDWGCQNDRNYSKQRATSLVKKRVFV